MLSLMGFSGSLPLYVIHRYYISVFIDWANNLRCLLACLDVSPPGRFAPLDVSTPGRDLPGRTTKNYSIIVLQYRKLQTFRKVQNVQVANWQIAKRPVTIGTTA